MESSPNRLKAGAYRAAVRLYQITSQHPDLPSVYGRNSGRHVTRKVWKAVLRSVLKNSGPSGRYDPRGNRHRRRALYVQGLLA